MLSAEEKRVELLSASDLTDPTRVRVRYQWCKVRRGTKDSIALSIQENHQGREAICPVFLALHFPDTVTCTLSSEVVTAHGFALRA